ncbi:MAG: copper-translocating P-type ATPase [Nostocales cyanobacterium]|nr:MAG: copper-translocating P-type ATPase [Nostocales cyanobacterium]
MQLVPETQKIPENTPITEKIILDVGGMKCAGCVKAVERQLSQNPNLKNICVNLATEVAVVEAEVGTVDAQALAQTLTATGFPTQLRTANSQSDQKRLDPEVRQHQEMQEALRQLIIAFVLLLFSGIGHFGNHLPILNNIWFHCGLATVALLIPGLPIIKDGWLGWRRGAPNMNTLVSLGTLTAYTASLIALLFPQMGWECFFDEPVMMLGFILLGRTLEKQARSKAASAFRELLALQPQIAKLIINPDSQKYIAGANVIEIPAEQVKVGEWLQVLPGDKIPVDGEVKYGQTTVDESMLTGEAVPVIKQPGDHVAAGTINQSGAIAIQATRTGNDTTLAQIVALVEAAQTRKAPVQKLADTVAGYFTYFVLTASLLTFVFWYFWGTHIWPEVNISTTTMEMLSHGVHQQVATIDKIDNSGILISLKLAIAVMVVACPCALGLATPTAILVGTGIGAEQGLLIKGGDVLEKVHKLNTIVFDKTGTLTTGKPQITDYLLFTDIEKSALLQLAAAVESGTYHPLATAINQAATTQNLSIPNAEQFHTEPGMGVSAVVDHKTILLGNREWLNWHGITISDTAQAQIETLAAAGKTVINIAIEDTLVGVIAVSDTLRTEAKTTVEQLQNMGLRVMLLSGDRAEAANAIAQQLGLEQTNVIAGIPPAKKASTIQYLQTSANTTPSIIAMVGDGINDAPALSQADVGIALHSGTDVAMETAEIILMRDSLSDVVAAIQLSRATFGKIRQNLFWAFAYNTIGIPLAAGVLLPNFNFVLSPSSAAALMAFSSVSVVTNSVLLRSFTHQH